MIAKAVLALETAGVHVDLLELPPDFDSISEHHDIINAMELRTSLLADLQAHGPSTFPANILDSLHNVKGYTNKQLSAALDDLAKCRAAFDAIAARGSSAFGSTRS